MVPLLWPKMREECGDGLRSSLAGQSHSAGPKARDDPARHLFFFTCQTLRTAKARPEQSLLKQSPLQWCVLDTNGGRQRRHLCLMKYISQQQLHKKIFTKQKDEQVKKTSSGQFWLLCIQDSTGCYHLCVALEDSSWQKALPT